MADLPEFYRPKHFSAEEFLPRETFARHGAQGLYLFLDVRVLITADAIREFFGAKVTANDWKWGGKFNYRGYRPDSWYARHGKDAPASGSQHRFGRALDLDVAGATAVQVRDIMLNHPQQFPFVKRIEDDVSWLHFDVANVFHRGIHLIQRR